MTTQVMKILTSGQSQHFAATLNGRKGWVVIYSNVFVGSFALSFCCGALAAAAIDHYVQDLKGYHQAIINAAIMVPIAIGGLCLLAFIKNMNGAVLVVSTGLATGFVVGLKLINHYSKHSDRRVIQHKKSINDRWDPQKKKLDLWSMDLTDDNLRDIGTSGLYKEVRWLHLGNNPQITMGGLVEYVGKGAFPRLERLTISANLQFKKSELQRHPISTAGIEVFATLKTLSIKWMKLTEDDLSYMIEHFQWVKNLEELNLWGNDKTLKRLPDNIDELKKLKKIGINCFVGHVTMTPALIALGKQDKVKNVRSRAASFQRKVPPDHVIN